MRGMPFAHFSSPMEVESWSTCDCLSRQNDMKRTQQCWGAWAGEAKNLITYPATRSVGVA